MQTNGTWFNPISPSDLKNLNTLTQNLYFSKLSDFNDPNLGIYLLRLHNFYYIGQAKKGFEKRIKGHITNIRKIYKYYLNNKSRLDDNFKNLPVEFFNELHSNKMGLLYIKLLALMLETNSNISDIEVAVYKVIDDNDPSVFNKIERENIKKFKSSFIGLNSLEILVLMHNPHHTLEEFERASKELNEFLNDYYQPASSFFNEFKKIQGALSYTWLLMQEMNIKHMNKSNQNE